jgi:hypothetical protein
MAANIGGWLLYFAIVAALIFVGWNEPLRYRFLTRAEIRNIEHPPPPVTPPPPPRPATPPPGAWMNDPAHKSPLNLAPGGSR